MENNKYYTPDISEFHIGFEFYMKFKSRLHNHKWELCKPQTLETIQIALSKAEIKVKYLDQQDIESFGFEKISIEHPIKNRDEFEIEYNDERKVFDKASLIYSYNINHLLISVGDDETPYENWETLFVGKVKNKSTLKQILTLTGVL